MRVISENSPEEIAAKRAEQARQDALAQVTWRLRDLAANLLRVVRGAGKPWEVGPQAQEVVVSMIQYRDIAGVYPASEEISAALNIEPKQELLDRLNDENRDRSWTMQKMLRGALQMAASELLDQNTQKATGRNEFFEGVREWQRLNEEANAVRDGRAPKRPKPVKL